MSEVSKLVSSAGKAVSPEFKQYPTVRAWLEATQRTPDEIVDDPFAWAALASIDLRRATADYMDALVSRAEIEAVHLLNGSTDAVILKCPKMLTASQMQQLRAAVVDRLGKTLADRVLITAIEAAD